MMIWVLDAVKCAFLDPKVVLHYVKSVCTIPPL